LGASTNLSVRIIEPVVFAASCALVFVTEAASNFFSLADFRGDTKSL
jgi:hypothetical protein